MAHAFRYEPLGETTPSWFPRASPDFVSPPGQSEPGYARRYRPAIPLDLEQSGLFSPRRRKLFAAALQQAAPNEYLPSMNSAKP